MKRVGLYTLGCKVAQYETEAIAEYFEAFGYTVSDFNERNDVYVINTCTVTAEADKKSRQIIRRAKRQNPDAKILVCGCYSQRTPDEIEKMPEVDAVIGSGGKLRLVRIAEELLSGRAKVSDVTDIYNEPFEPMRITRGPRTRVYVKIEDGCESKCSYCAIPSARGNVRSKPANDVIEEVEALTKSGVPEIVLTGIETGSYGKDFGTGYGLGDLLAELDQRKSAERIRLGSLAPELIGSEFAEKIKGLGILAPHFHVSIQSGSDRTLAAMRRRYTRNRALENIKRIKDYIPDATFTTDLMVGFPGETEEDFLETVSFAEEVEFLSAHVFCYSRRKNTVAAELPDQIPEAVKHDRSHRLIERIESISHRVLDDIIEKQDLLDCIFEEQRGEMWYGHSACFAEVMISSNKDLHGKKLSVLPIRREGNIIIGKTI